MTNEVCLRNGLSYPGMPQAIRRGRDQADMSCPEEYSNPLLPEFSSKIPTQGDSNELLAGRDYLKRIEREDRHTVGNFGDKVASFSGYLNYLSNFNDTHATIGEQIARAAAMPAVILGALISSPFISFACGEVQCGREGVEVCDGIDNDCDGFVDETLNSELLAEEQALPKTEFMAGNPASNHLIWNGSNIVLAWESIFFPRPGQTPERWINLDGYNPDGAKARGISFLSPAEGIESLRPQPAWNGHGYGLLVNADMRLIFTWHDPDFEWLSSKVLNEEGSVPQHSLLFQDGEYKISHVVGEEEFRRLYFTRLNEEGERVGQDLKLSDYAHHPSLACNNESCGLAWIEGWDNSQIYFWDSEYGEVKSIIIPEEDAELSSRTGPLSLVRNSSGYALAYFMGSRTEDLKLVLHFARFGHGGEQVIRREVAGERLSPLSRLDLTEAGSEYGLVWNGANSAVSAGVLDREGVLEEQIRLGEGHDPTIIFDGRSYWASWNNFDDGEQVWKNYLAKVTKECLRY